MRIPAQADNLPRLAVRLLVPNEVAVGDFLDRRFRLDLAGPPVPLPEKLTTANRQGRKIVLPYYTPRIVVQLKQGVILTADDEVEGTDLLFGYLTAAPEREANPLAIVRCEIGDQGYCVREAWVRPLTASETVECLVEEDMP